MRFIKATLVVLSLAACGAPSEEEQNDQFIGETTEATTTPLGYGIDSVNTSVACKDQATEVCWVPNTKHVQRTTVVNTGHCSGTFWASTEASAASAIGGDSAGTGFSYTPSIGGVFVSSEKCVSTLPGGAFARFTVTGTGECTTHTPASHCKLTSATFEVAGDTIVNFCNSQPGFDCTTFVRGIWYSMFSQTAGNAPTTSLTAAMKSRMTAYVP